MPLRLQRPLTMGPLVEKNAMSLSLIEEACYLFVFPAPSVPFSHYIWQCYPVALHVRAVAQQPPGTQGSAYISHPCITLVFVASDPATLK